jgi:hypothetical protein
MYAPAYMDQKRPTRNPGVRTIFPKPTNPTLNKNHRTNRPVPEGRLNFTQDAVLGLEFLHFREGASIQDLAERGDALYQGTTLVGPLRSATNLGF